METRACFVIGDLVANALADVAAAAGSAWLFGGELGTLLGTAAGFRLVEVRHVFGDTVKTIHALRP